MANDHYLKFCPKCDKQIKASCTRCYQESHTDYRFCPYCGTELEVGLADSWLKEIAEEYQRHPKTIDASPKAYHALPDLLLEVERLKREKKKSEIPVLAC